MPRKLLIAIPSLLALLIIGTFAYLKTLDFNQYKGLISEEIEKATGRQLSIGGDLDLKLSLHPTLRVNDVRLGNAPWGVRQDMARIGRLEAQVALLPLLFGNVQVQRLVLIDADVLLETHLMGKGNWVFGDEAKTAEQGEAPLPAVGEIELKNLKLTWREGRTGKTTVLQLERLTAQAASPSTPLQLALQGSLDDEPFKVSGKLSPFDDLVAGTSLRLELVAEAGGAKLRLEGGIAEPAAAKGIDLKLAAEGADLATLSGLAGTKLPPIAPWKASLALADHPQGVKADAIQAQLGASDLSGSLTITQREGKTPLLEGTLHSALLDLAALRGPEDEQGPPKQKQERLFSSQPLALDALKKLDVAVSYGADQLVNDKLILTQLSADVRLSNGVLSIEPLQAGFADSVAQGRLRLDAASKPPRLDFKLTAKGLDLGQLLKVTTDEETLSGKGDLSIALKGQGQSVAAIMGSLDGHTRLLVGQGTLRTGAVDSLIGGLSTVVGTLVAEQKDTAVMNCLASDFDIKQGVATSRTLLVDTEYSTVFGEGNIDFSTETLGLLIAPKPKSVTLNVAVPVQVGGTLANPIFGLEKVAAARKAAGVLALVGGLAFPPAALLGLGEMGAGDDHPCLQIAQGKGAAAPAEKKQEGGVKGALEDVGSKLKGLFGN